ncbi:MAG TPA: glycoside hydrolase, partial [Dysgonamonadaceae bacterium]|nr:glycoside hydrolase [Dysgonamonadaceae bacterium]
RTLTDSTLYLRVRVFPEARCVFSYSLEGKIFKTLGKPFTAKEGKWIGAKMGFFCYRPVRNNDGGRVEIDWFKVE